MQTKKQRSIVRFFLSLNYFITNMKETSKIGYWEFVEEYYPNYYKCDKILESNLLLTKIETLDSSKNYEKKLNKLKKELFKTDKKILINALKNYFEKT